MKNEISYLDMLRAFIKAAFEIKNMPFSPDEEKEWLIKAAEYLNLDVQDLKEPLKSTSSHNPKEW